MLRTFDTHKIRKTRELSGRLWDFTPAEGEYAGKTQKVMVPSCLETYPGFGNYRGLADYETTFEAQGNVRLEFKGVSHFARVFIDGRETASHYGSYTPFSVCVTGLAAGTHTLKVAVDNAFRDEYSLDFPNDYMSYGGISRGVCLDEIGELFLQWVHITPLKEENGVWTVRAEVSVRNLAESAGNALLSLSLAGQELISSQISPAPGEQSYTFENLTVTGVTPWSMESPVLYPIQARLSQDGQVFDDLIDRTGFRLVQVQDSRILLNGRPVRIKGFCRHEDHPHFGCALPAEAIARDLQLVRDLGANSIRTSHYPNDELFLDMCDEMGILVWEENHARGLSEEQMRNPFFEPQCEEVIRAMITAHYNHPSIYIWGILNECASDTALGRECYQAQFSLIRSLDLSRPVSYASCKYNADICQDLPDICSWNMYPYWYDDETAVKKIEDLDAFLGKQGIHKPLIVSEVGAGAIYAFRDTAKDVWSEDLQAEILGKQLTEIFSKERCCGLYIWQFCDVRVSRIWWAMRRPKSRNNKGLVDEYRRPKLAYDVVKGIFEKLENYW